MGDAQPSYFIENKVVYKSHRLYTYAFPIIILLSLLFLIVVIFVVPVEKAVDATRGMLSLKKLETVRNAVGGLGNFKFRNAFQTGVLGAR